MKTSLECGKAYRDLGLDEDARKEFRKIPPSDPDFSDAWSAMSWLSSRADRAEQAALGDEGLALIRKGHNEPAVVHATAACLDYAGYTLQAYRLLRAHQRRISWSAADHYGMACYAGKIGYWAEAAWHLILCIRQGGDSHMFLDLDLAPLFRHAAECPLDQTLALAIGHPRFKHEFDKLRGQCLEIDSAMEKQLPPSLHSQLIKIPESGFKTLSPRATPEEAQRFRQWRDEVGGQIEATVARAIRRADNFILDAQMEWARNAARIGDVFAARNHTVFALAKRPAWLPLFEERLRPLGMGYLFQDLRDPMAEDPHFCRHILRNTPFNDPDGLEAFSPAGRKSCLFKLLHACMFNKQSDGAGNARLTAELIRRWPRDPAPFLNAAMFAVRCGEWEAARKFLSGSPPSIHHLRMTRTLIRDVATRTQEVAFAGYEEFYGQPDIGNTVRRLPSARIAFLRIRGSEFTVSKTIRPGRYRKGRSPAPIRRSSTPEEAL